MIQRDPRLTACNSCRAIAQRIAFASVRAAQGVVSDSRSSGYLRLEHADANRFFQLINRRYTRSSMIITSSKRVSEWAGLFGDEVQTVAILDRLLHDAEILTIKGPSWRVRGRGDLLFQRSETAENGENSPTDTRRRPGRGPQTGSHDVD
jgi:hypothetical protein